MNPLDDSTLGLAWVDQEHKLLFRGIQKAASTAFHQLFLKLAGDVDYDAPPFGKTLVTRLDSLPAGQRHDILHDPAWTRAVVLRDPFERLASAFLHLIRDGSYRIRVDGQVVGFYPRQFKDFLDVITDGGDEIVLPDVHWRPQSQFFPTIDLFNVVIDFNRLAEQGRQLVRRVGAWEEHGRSGWGAHRREPFLTSTQQGHATGARYQMSHFATHADRVRRVYRTDYSLLDAVTFGFSRERDASDTI